jgi:hypothetical protein
MAKKQQDYDTPWKEILDNYFQDFMAFFFPKAYNDIVWSKKYESLDKELQKAVRDASLGKRLVDKLVKVWRKDGKETWVLVHIEIQSQKETNFAKRMYVYNYRIFDRHDHPVVSLALLCDEVGYKLWDFELGMKFPVIKLLDYKDQWDMLEKSQNPFAIVVMAHLKAQETRNNDQECKLWKIKLARMLYGKRYKKQDIINLLRFLDWVMQLPKELEDEFWQEMQQYEEGKRMPYLMDFEKKAIKRGMQEGKKIGEKIGREEGREEGEKEGMGKGFLAGIKLGLKLKFGDEGLKLLPEINEIKDVELLQTIHGAIETANTLDDLRQKYQ